MVPEIGASAVELIKAGDELSEAGELEAAIARYEQALQVEPGNAEALVSIVDCLTRQGHGDEASRRLAAARAEHHYDTAGQSWVALGLLVTGDEAAAAALAAELTARREEWKNDLPAATRLAEVHEALDAPQAALDVIETGLAGQGVPLPGSGADALRDAHVRRVTALRALGRWPDLLNAAEQALQLFPEDSRFLLDAAEALAELDRGPEATTTARRAAESTGPPRLDPWEQLRLVLLLARVGLDDLSRATLTAAGAKAGGNHDLSRAVAKAWFARDEPEPAIELLDADLAEASWADSEPALQSVELRALCLTEAGQHARAVADLDRLRAHGITPTDPVGRLYAGTSYTMTGRYDDAEEPLSALVTEGTDPRLRLAALIQLAIGAAGTNRRDQLQDRVGQALTLADDLALPPDHPTRAALDLLRAKGSALEGDWGQVLAVTDSLLPRLSGDNRAAAALLRGEALARRGRGGDALALFDGELDGEPAVPGSTLRGALHMWRGLLRRGHGDWRGARDDFAAALAAGLGAPDRRFLAIALAGCETALGDPQSALSRLDALAAEGPEATEQADYWDARAGALIQLSQFDTAAAALQRMAEADPARRRISLLFQVGFRVLGGDWSAWSTVLDELVQEPSADAPALDWLIVAFARQMKDRPDARQALDRATELDPAAPASELGRYVRMQLAVEDGDLEAFESARTASPGPVPGTTPDPWAEVLTRSMRGQLLLNAKDRQAEAAAEFAAAASAAAEHPGPRTTMPGVVALARQAQVLARLGKLDAARDALADADRRVAELPRPGGTKVIVDIAAADLRLRVGAVNEAQARLDDAAANAAYLPDELTAVVHYLRGKVLRLSGEDEAALAALERASALDPTDIPTLLALAENLLAVGDVDRAVEVLDQIVETAASQAPGDPDDQVTLQARVLRLRSTALRRAGRDEAALADARRAAGLEPAEPRCWIALAEAHEALGRLDQAAQNYRRAWRQSRDDDHHAARALVGLTRVLILADRPQAAVDELEHPENGARTARVARAYGAVDYNHAVALLRVGSEHAAADRLRAASRAEHPVPDARRLAGDLGTRRAREGSWPGFWFTDPGSRRGHAAAGSALLLAGVAAAGLALADPRRVSWLAWVSTDWTARAVPLLIVAALLLLPTVSRLSLGGVEVQNPDPAPGQLPDLAPTTIEEVIDQVSTAVQRLTHSLTAPTASAAGPHPAPSDVTELPDHLATPQITATGLAALATDPRETQRTPGPPRDPPQAPQLASPSPPTRSAPQ